MSQSYHWLIKATFESANPWHTFLNLFLQRGRITGNAERCNTYSNSVCLSITRWYPIQMNEGRIMLSSLWGSKNTLVIWYQQRLSGQRSLSCKICAQTVPPPFEKCRLWPIFAYNIATVKASEKSLLIANRKSITRFRTSYRWSPYVTPKSPKGWLRK